MPAPYSEDLRQKVLHAIDQGNRKSHVNGYRERDEAKRQAFLEQLQQYVPDHIVYVDEAGADNNEDYDYGWCALCE